MDGFPNIHEHIKFNSDECEQQLSDKSTLRLHKLRVHKVYSCDKCEYQEKEKIQLNPMQLLVTSTITYIVYIIIYWGTVFP